MLERFGNVPNATVLPYPQGYPDRMANEGGVTSRRSDEIFQLMVSTAITKKIRNYKFYNHDTRIHQAVERMQKNKCLKTVSLITQENRNKSVGKTFTL